MSKGSDNKIVWFGGYKNAEDAREGGETSRRFKLYKKFVNKAMREVPELSQFGTIDTSPDTMLIYEKSKNPSLNLSTDGMKKKTRSLNEDKIGGKLPFKGKGINVNDDAQPFTDEILDGEKTVETRRKPTLRSLVGSRVGLIKTGKRKKAMLVGFVDIVDEKQYKSREEFEQDAEAHRVGSDSPFMKDGGYGYVLENPVRVEPVPVDSRGIVIRKLEYK